MTKLFPFTVTALIAAGATSFAQHAAMPPGMTHEEHQTQMRREAETKQRGAVAMGFDQDAVAHHFLLAKDGGTIRVEVKDAGDTASRDAIRIHLRQVAADFAAGVFDAPFATHGETPPGVPAMQAFTSTLRYAFSETDSGGEVRIVTGDAAAIAAVHDFLRYQIKEHRTGDPLAIG